MKNGKEDLEKQLEQLDHQVKIGMMTINEIAKQAITAQVQSIKEVQQAAATAFSEIKNLDETVRNTILDNIKRAEKEPGEVNWDDLLNV